MTPNDAPWPTYRSQLQTEEEIDGNVAVWIEADLSPLTPAQLAAAFPGARDLGRRFQERVNLLFLDYFEMDSTGGARVRRTLERRLPCCSDALVEGILDRVHDKRARIVRAVYKAIQRQLLDPSRSPCVAEDRLKTELLPFYFQTILRNECARDPAAAVRGFNVSLPDEEVGGPVAPPPPDEDYVAFLQAVAGRLQAFWGPANGFDPEDTLEGMVSAGVGHLIGGCPSLRQKCADVYDEGYQRWVKQQDKLTANASALLARRAEPEADQESLDARVARLRQKLAVVRRACLRPTPRCAARLLRDELAPAAVHAGPRHPAAEARPSQTNATTRYRRLRARRLEREGKLLGQRVVRALREVGNAVSAADEQRLGEIRFFLDKNNRPPSPSQHGISEDERAKRWQRLDEYLERASRLRDDVTARLLDLYSEDLDHRPFRALLGVMDDAANFLEGAVLSRAGILPALESRHGWRLFRLLRTNDGAWEGIS